MADREAALNAWLNSCRQLPLESNIPRPDNYADASNQISAFRAGWAAAVGPFAVEMKRKLCENCQGTGKIYDEPKKWIICPVCGGTGYVGEVPVKDITDRDSLRQAIVSNLDRILNLPHAFTTPDERRLASSMQSVLAADNLGTNATLDDILTVYKGGI